MEGSAPGIEALFSPLREDGTHAVLDLGPAQPSHLAIYSRFARRIRFADLLGAPGRGESWETALESLPGAPGKSFDVVLAWDLLDRISPKYRPVLVETLVRLTSPEARLHVLVDPSEKLTVPPVRFTLRNTRTVARRLSGDAQPAWPPVMPAEVERLLRPFEVIHAFTLRSGYRAYVAEK